MHSRPWRAVEGKKCGQPWTGVCDNCWVGEPRVSRLGGSAMTARLSDFSRRGWKPGFVCKNLSIFKCWQLI